MWAVSRVSTWVRRHWRGHSKSEWRRTAESPRRRRWACDRPPVCWQESLASHSRGATPSSAEVETNLDTDCVRIVPRPLKNKDKRRLHKQMVSQGQAARRNNNILFRFIRSHSWKKACPSVGRSFENRPIFKYTDTRSHAQMRTHAHNCYIPPHSRAQAHCKVRILTSYEHSIIRGLFFFCNFFLAWGP